MIASGPSLVDLLANVADIRTRCRLLEETVAVIDQLSALLSTIPTAYRRVHDANIIATMLVWDIRRLLTHNGRDFAPYGHLITVVPLV